MNYFGLFFTFMLPGLVLGAMAATAMHAEKGQKSQRVTPQKQKEERPVRGKLYIHSIMADMEEHAA